MVSVIVFHISTILLIKEVKKKGIGFVKNAVTNPIIPNFDLGFFEKNGCKNKTFTEMKLLSFVNKTAQYSCFIAFTILFALVVVKEIIKY
jgi:hypothetical protein